MTVNWATMRVHDIDLKLEDYTDEEIENNEELMALVEEKQQLIEDYYIDKNYLAECYRLGV